MHSWQGGGEFISMTMTTAKTMVGERVDTDEDDDTTKNPTARTTSTSLFDTTLVYVNDNSNNDGRGEG
jgi:hypothetical protein